MCWWDVKPYSINQSINVKGSTPGWALLLNNLSQVVYNHTCGPRHEAVEFGTGLTAIMLYSWEGNCWPDGLWHTTRFLSNVTCVLTALLMGSAVAHLHSTCEYRSTIAFTYMLLLDYLHMLLLCSVTAWRRS